MTTLTNFLYLALGVLCGVITGLFPGIHPNNIVALSFLILPYFGLDAYIPFLIGLVITHYFINFIPSAFLGVPDDETAVSALPMHKLTLEGRGYEAVILAGFGSFLGGIFSIIIGLIIMSFFDIGKFYISIKAFIPFLLMMFVLYQLLTARSFWEVLVIILSGIFGIVVLYHNNAYSITLTAIFTGMFGIPLLINNIKTPRLKSQLITFPDFEISFIKSSFFAAVVGFFRIFLPGISGSQLNYIISKILKESDIKNFIVSQGGIILSNEVFSILSLIFIGIGRSGVARFIQNLNVSINVNDIILYILISSTIALIILINLSKYMLLFIRKINFRALSLFLIALCSIIIIIGSYNDHLLYHIVIYVTSICIGLLALRSNSNLSNMMNVLIFPTILYLLRG